MKRMSLNGNVTLALIAHDRRKAELADFILEHRGAFKRFNIVATAGTGTSVQKRTGLPVYLLEHGNSGGDRQLGEMVIDNEVQAVIVFRDLAGAGPNEPDLAQLREVCDARDIPIATNRATAEALLYFLLNSPNRGVITARPWATTPSAPGEYRTGAARSPT